MKVKLISTSSNYSVSVLSNAEFIAFTFLNQTGLIRARNEQTYEILQLNISIEPINQSINATNSE